ncbi:MAG: NTP transferase domain-containing protein [Spirochaetales bacterium]|nr:NTP transferase domain-containing protein [Spirochaetales bacterium]
MPDICAVVLAGGKRGAKAIHHKNKAFLEFCGEPLIIHVLRSIQKAKQVKCIVAVGPKDKLAETIAASTLDGKAEITIVEQRQNLLENGKAGFIHSLGMEYSPALFDSLRLSEYSDQAAIFVSCDIPLVTPWEIDEFISKADIVNHEYTLGVTSEEVMQSYYPSDDKPGIKMAYFHLKEGRCRHNNLHIAKPLKIHRLAYVERMYLTRYQKKMHNIFAFFLSLFLAGPWMFSALKVFLGLQIARSRYVRHGGGWYYEKIRSTNSVASACKCVGGVMSMRMEVVYTSYGGAVLDVDNAEDLEVAETMRSEWMKHQEGIVTNLGHGNE